MVHQQQQQQQHGLWMWKGMLVHRPCIASLWTALAARRQSLLAAVLLASPDGLGWVGAATEGGLSHWECAWGLGADEWVQQSQYSSSSSSDAVRAVAGAIAAAAAAAAATAF